MPSSVRRWPVITSVAGQLRGNHELLIPNVPRGPPQAATVAEDRYQVGDAVGEH
jgi:hypothetical protein